MVNRLHVVFVAALLTTGCAAHAGPAPFPTPPKSETQLDQILFHLEHLEEQLTQLRATTLPELRADILQQLNYNVEALRDEIAAAQGAK